MPANLTDIGIQSTSQVALLEGLDYDAKVESAMIMTYEGKFGAAATFNDTIEWSMSGRGDVEAALAIGTDGGASSPLTGITDGAGTTTNIISSVSYSETNTDFPSWDVSGTYYPNTV